MYTGASVLFGLFFLLSTPAQAQTLKPFSSAALGSPPAPWRVAGLPANKAPLAELDIVQLGPQKALRLRTDHSYGTVIHALPAQTPAGTLRWRWRLDQPVADADLRRKEGDDAPIKVCAMFDLPLDKLGFVERNLLRVARIASGEHLAGATLCYVWDQKLPVGTELANAYTRRVRFIVLNSASTPLQQWVTHTRDLRADFLRSFGTETDTVPPLLAIVAGADSDNTGGSSLAYLDDLSLVEQ